jgi:outer membrane immunogenic protein
MKKILLSTTALIAMTAMAAAADLPARTVAPAPVYAPPVFTWTGFYAGINGGYVWSENDIRLRGTTGLTPAQIALVPDRFDVDDDGFTIGGHVGYNWQFGTFVAGLEADIAYTDLGRTATIAVPAGVLAPVAVGPGTLTGSGGLDFLGTVRGRVGLAFDRFMVYGTGGFAYGGVSGRLSTDFAGTAFDFISNEDDDMRFGWAAGVGAEYAFTNNLVLGVEYLHYELGRDTIRVGDTRIINTDYRTTNTGDLIRGRLSFKF